MKILQLRRQGDQFVYAVTEDGLMLFPEQYGTRSAETTVAQARDRFAFDAIRSSFVTGRQYREDGTEQEIFIAYVPFTGNIFDDESTDVVLVDLVDNARGIHELVKVMRSDCTPSSIHFAALSSYDNNHYGRGEIGSVVSTK